MPVLISSLFHNWCPKEELKSHFTTPSQEYRPPDKLSRPICTVDFTYSTFGPIKHEITSHMPPTATQIQPFNFGTNKCVTSVSKTLKAFKKYPPVWQNSTMLSPAKNASWGRCKKNHTTNHLYAENIFLNISTLTLPDFFQSRATTCKEHLTGRSQNDNDY